MRAADHFRAMRGRAPEEAKFFWSGGPIEVAERTWFQSRFSGVIAFETAEGIVLVDSGLARLAPALAAALREKTSGPVHTAIFTHGHVDHAFGLKAFLQPGQPRPRVIAQRAALDRFARYERTSRYNAAINARQFGGSAERSQPGDGEYDNFRRPELMPDTLFDRDLAFRVGGLDFEVHHCRAETDDHCWVFCPQRSVVCSGDLIINAVPNAGNPQKVQRYPWDWAEGLRRIAALAPRSLCPGHGGPVVNDPAKVRRMLIETAEYLEDIVAQTLAALNDGAPPHTDIVHRVKPPASDSAWLQPVYDEAEFIVRNVIRFHGGWWNGRPSELKPAPRKSLAREIAALCGGADALVRRAREIAQAGDLRLACHLADFALESSPQDGEIADAVAAIYTARADTEPGLMAENLFRSAAAYARERRPFC